MPSMPRQLNVTCGNSFTSFQAILLVMKVSRPHCRAICGSEAGNPKVSGKYKCRCIAASPNRDAHHAVPLTIWRMSDSPDGIKQSGSTHMPPPASQRPSFTRSEICENSAGCMRSIHSYCCGWLQRNVNVGLRSISRSIVAKVRVHLRLVSSSVQSHAVSIWAWPIAVHDVSVGEPALMASSRVRIAAAAFSEEVAGET